MPKLHQLTLAGVMLALTALPALAEWYPHEAAGVSLYFPDHWLVEVSDDSMLAATTPDETVGVVVRVFEVADLEAALGALESELMSVVADFQPSGYYEDTLNGMPMVAGEGTGVIEGYPAEVALLVVLTPADKALMVFGAGQQEFVAQYQADLDTIFANISPL